MENVWVHRKHLINNHCHCDDDDAMIKRMLLLTTVMEEGKGKGGGSMFVIQFSSDTQSCLTLCNPMNHSTPGLPVHHQLPKSTQTHVH